MRDTPAALGSCSLRHLLLAASGSGLEQRYTGHVVWKCAKPDKIAGGPKQYVACARDD